MAEEPDGGQEPAGDPAVRDGKWADEWADLQPAVRRVTTDESDASVPDSEATGNADDCSSEPDDWSDLAPAIRPAGDGDGGDGNDGGGKWEAEDDVDDGDSGTDEDDGDGFTPAIRPVDGSAAGDGADDREGGDGEGDADDGEGNDGDEGGEGDEDDWEWSEDDYPNLDPSSEDGGELDLVPEEHERPDRLERESDADDPGAAVAEPDDAPDPIGGGFSNAPDSDVEQPLAVHIEEMVKRLAIVIAVAGLVSVAVFPFTEPLIDTIWNHVLPGGEAVDPRVYHPLELIITQFKVASLAGLVIALPVLVYESYVFMRPGLYKNERRYYLAAVPTSLVLAVLGVVFSYFVVLPYTMSYFQGYTENTANVAFALGTTFNLILMVMGYLAVVFQIPLFIMLAIMLGVVTRKWLEDRRLLFWGAFAGISFAFGSIDPTGVVPVLVAITMIVLFEGTLALLRWTGN